MNPHHRQLAHFIVEQYATIRPLERHMRRTDLLYAVVFVVGMALFGWSAWTQGGWSALFNLALAVVAAFGYGVIFAGVRQRRAAYAAIEEAAGIARLDLAVLDDESAD